MKVGMRIQAVDQIGRWEDGKIVTVLCDNGSCVVKFMGWSEHYNRTVVREEIRVPVEPFHSTSTGKSCLHYLSKRRSVY